MINICLGNGVPKAWDAAAMGIGAVAFGFEAGVIEKQCQIAVWGLLNEGLASFTDVTLVI